MRLKVADEIANSVYLDQSAPRSSPTKSALFAQICLSQYYEVCAQDVRVLHLRPRLNYLNVISYYAIKPDQFE